MTASLPVLRSCLFSYFVPHGIRLVVRFLSAWVVLVVFWVSSPKLDAQVVLQSQATDLSDVTPGVDLWEYTYSISGFDFQTNQGFSVFFDDQLYGNLQNPRPSSSPDWSVITVQPDVILHDPGFLDALALTNSPSTVVPFQVDFVWLGQGVPGSQPFYIYDSTFTPISSGSSVIVPEPQTWLLASCGTLVVWLARRARAVCSPKPSESK